MTQVYWVNELTHQILKRHDSDHGYALVCILRESKKIDSLKLEEQYNSMARIVEADRDSD